MSQAFNLSQFANKLNTSGQIDATTGLTGTFPTTNLPTIPINKGGTNLTTVGSNGTVVQTDGSAYTYGSVSGTLTWDTVKTTGFTAVAGYGYFVNTTSGAITVTLPASPSIGQKVVIVDYAGTFATNNVTVDPNGSKINTGGSKLLQTNRMGIAFVYIDATQGWLAQADVYSGNPPFVAAPINISYLMIAGGGGGGGTSTNGNSGGGGGAGGYLSGTTSLTSGSVYTVTVGGGGAGGVITNGGQKGTNGDNSLVTGLTTVIGGGGGGGAQNGTVAIGANGGSGGGGGNSGSAGGTATSGQGYAGGTAVTYGGAGGGGAGAVGANATGSGYSPTGGNGGSGASSSITGSSVTYAGGGGGGSWAGTTHGTGGSGGGGNAGGSPTAGTANTGSGGGGAGTIVAVAGANGGSGVVILSVPTAQYSGTSTGSPTVTTSGSNTILKYTSSGSYTA